VGGLFYRTFIVQGRLLFTEFLNVRKRLGELREDVDVEASAAFFLSGLTFILLVVELFGGKQVESLDEERLVRSMSDVFLSGIERRSPCEGCAERQRRRAEAADDRRAGAARDHNRKFECGLCDLPRSRSRG